MQPKISIITICYNAQICIEFTIQSVLRQTYTNIEYILVDGKSTDSTVDIIRKYAFEVESKANFSYVWISEPDKGIYDAMNKGLHLATGEYVWFMNAGDTIYSSDTLQILFKNLKSKVLHTGNKILPDIIYGDAMIVDEERRELGLRTKRPPEELTWKSFRMGMLVCHQSILIKREIATDYDIRYKFVADIDWIIKALKVSKYSYNAKQILSNFLEGGFSKINERKSWKERFQVMVKYYGFVQTLYYHIKIAYNHLCRLEK